MPRRPTVSVVINTLNRADVLERVLSAAGWLSYPPGFEVIVVNGPSTDQTEQLLEQWKSRIKIGRCQEANLSKSRNVGIAMAAGDIVAFIDDDAVPEPEWLEQLAVAFDDDEVAIAGGHVYDHTGVTFQYRYGTVDRLGTNAQPLQGWDPAKLAYPQSSRIPYPIGTNSAFRRSALLAIGGFDEEYEYFLDETDLVIRLIDAGWMIKQLPRAFVHHKFAPSSMRGPNRVPKRRYSIVKNHVYFGLRHGRNHYSAEQLNDEQHAFIAAERASVQHAIEAGLLVKSDLRQYDEDAAKGLDDGRQHAAGPVRLLTAADARRQYQPFLPFATVVTHPVRRAVISAERQTTEPERAELRRLASEGWVLHLLEYAETLHTVDFDRGIWIHALGDERYPGDDWPTRVSKETDRLRRDRVIEMVVDIDSYQAALRASANATAGEHSSRHFE